MDQTIYKYNINNIMRRLLITILILLPAILLAQDFEFQLETDSIQVEIDGWTPFCPWAGGESECSPEFADIDADGDLDCFLGNFTGKITYFENQGTALAADYKFQERDYGNVNLGNLIFAGRTSPEFCDLDDDGDKDLFSGDFRGLIHFWINYGTSSCPIYELVTDTLAGIDADGYSKLEFQDIDLDNDFDIILGDYYGKVWIYLNTGSNTIFEFNTAPIWIQNIDIGYNASPALIDIDADNDLDLFIGERYGTIWFYRNDGDSANYSFTLVSDFFDSIDVGDYSSPDFADIDGDGDYDLFIGKEANSLELKGDVYFYENTGTPQNADFVLRAKNYLMLDIHQTLPRPQLIDINGDGAKDILAGVGGSLNFFENTGDSLEAEFLFIEEEFQDIYEPGIKPCFVDIDNDGDYDLITGEGVIPGPPDIALYLNEGTPRNPNFQLYNSQFVTNSDFLVNINPGTADIDGDGDYDLFISDDDGHFFYYQNDGNPSWPDFAWQSNQWQGIQFEGMWRGFHFIDMDTDQDLDLMIMSPNDYNLAYWENIGNPLSPDMILRYEILFPGMEFEPYPYLVDIDSDGDLDLFSGYTYGGILFFRNTTGDTSAVNPPLIQHPLHGIEMTFGPNPANPFIVARCRLQVASFVNLGVYDICGRLVKPLVSKFLLPGSHQFRWEAEDAASGVYVLRLQAGEVVQVKRVVVLR